MKGAYAYATDSQATKQSDNEQQQEAKLHEELLEQQAKDTVEHDDDSELVLNIDSCCTRSQLQCFCVLTARICLRMHLFLFSKV